MGNTDLDSCVQVVKQNASLPGLIAETLRNGHEMPIFVIDVSNIIHAQLHANDMDLVLRNSWKGFEQGVENILKTHARWFAPFETGTNKRVAVCYTQKDPPEYLIYVFDGERFTDKRANLTRENTRGAAHIRIQQQIVLEGLDSECLSAALSGNSIFKRSM